MNIYIKMLSLLILVALLTMCATAPKKVEEIDVGSASPATRKGHLASFILGRIETCKEWVNCITCTSTTRLHPNRSPWSFQKSVESVIKTNWKNSRRVAILSGLIECAFRESILAFLKKSEPPSVNAVTVSRKGVIAAIPLTGSL